MSLLSSLRSPLAAITAALLALGAALVVARAVSSMSRVDEVRAEHRDFVSEEDVSTWATFENREQLALLPREPKEAGLRLGSKSDQRVVFQAKPRRATRSLTAVLRFSGATDGIEVGLGIRAKGARRDERTETRARFEGGKALCVRESDTNDRDTRSVATRDLPCVTTDEGMHELALFVFVDEDTITGSFDGEPLQPELIHWSSATPLAPFVTVRSKNPSAVVTLHSLDIGTSNEEYVAGFDETFREPQLLSARWLILAADPWIIDSQVATGKGAFEIKAAPRHLRSLQPATTLRSRPFPLRKVEVGGDFDIAELEESANFVRIVGDSYWQPRRFDVGVLDVDGVVRGYCAGAWDHAAQVDIAKGDPIATTPHDVGKVSVRIGYDPKTKLGTGYVNGKLICSHEIDLPPFVNASLELGGNLHSEKARLHLRVTQAWFHP